jgi:hypothetical protein
VIKLGPHTYGRLLLPQRDLALRAFRDAICAILLPCVLYTITA